MTFTTDDGLRLEGRTFGTGSVGVILVHGDFETGQASWFTFAATLARHGYRVLTFNLRGFCPGRGLGCSEGGAVDPPKTWLDVAAAIDFIRGRGVESVFLIGSSLGAHTVLWAAAQPGIDVAGVVPISAPRIAEAAYSPDYDITERVLHRIAEPKLFMAGRSEPVFAADAKAMFVSSLPPKQLELLPSVSHGSTLFSGAEPRVARLGTKAILEFLSANS